MAQPPPQPTHGGVGGYHIMSLVHDPRDANRGSWSRSLFGRADLGPSAWTLPARPPLDPHKYPHYTRRDLSSYLRIVHTAHEEFLHERRTLQETDQRQGLLGNGEQEEEQQLQAAVMQAHSNQGGASGATGPGRAAWSAGQGDGLAQALHTVPSHFFQENFCVERSGLLSVSDEDGSSEITARLEQLTGHLDVVETQLMREVALRSRAVSQAAMQVGVLHQQLCEALGNIRRLRSRLADADEHTHPATCKVITLQRRRHNVDNTLQVLQALEEVHSSRSALQMLLDSQDYAGSLDLLDVLGHNMEAISMQGVSTFTAALPQMRSTREVLETALACEFVGLASFDAAHLVLDAAVARVQALGPGAMPTSRDLLATLALATAAGIGGMAQFGYDPPSTSQMRGHSDDGRNVYGKDDRDAPYSSNGGSYNGNDSYGHVANGHGHSGQEEVAAAAAAAREQLHDKLFPVVLALLRVDRLAGAMQQLRENVAAAGKGLVAEALERCLGPTGPAHLQQQGGETAAARLLLQDPESGSGSQGPLGAPGAGRSHSQGGQGPDGMAASSGNGGAPGPDSAMALALQGLGHDGFMQVLFVIHAVIASYLKHCSLVAAVIRQDILPASGATGVAQAAVARDAAAATQALSDVAHKLWVRLINSRASITPRLKLYEFQALVDACEAFAVTLEPCSAGGAMGVRTVAAAQGRTFLEALHARNVAQLQHLLEAEQWSLAQVPSQFQAVVDRVVARGVAAQQGGGHAEGGHMRTQSLAHQPSPQSLAVRLPSSSAGMLQSLDPSSEAGPKGTLQLQGKAFPLVSAALMLLKMLDEYSSFAGACTILSLDIAHRVCNLIKVFHEKTCQLVLGAGATRTAGLKSISTKHLALSCESCYMLACLLPSLQVGLLLPPSGRSGRQLGGTLLSGSDPRKAMLLREFQKLAEDLAAHTHQIHEKLVDIIQDRLVHAGKELRKEALGWGCVTFEALSPSSALAPTSAGPLSGAGAVWTDGFRPSPSLANLGRQLTMLHTVLQPIMQQEEVYLIFGRIVSVFSQALTETFDSLQHPGLLPPTQSITRSTTIPGGRAVGSVLPGQGGVPPAELAAWEEARRRNAVFSLQSLQQLPVDPSHSSTYLGKLSTFLVKHYGSTAAVLAPLPAAAAPSAGHPTLAAVPPPAAVPVKAEPAAQTPLAASAVSPSVLTAMAVPPASPRVRGNAEQRVQGAAEQGTAGIPGPPVQELEAGLTAALPVAEVIQPTLLPLVLSAGKLEASLTTAPLMAAVPHLDLVPSPTSLSQLVTDEALSNLPSPQTPQLAGLPVKAVEGSILSGVGVTEDTLDPLCCQAAHADQASAAHPGSSAQEPQACMVDEHSQTGSADPAGAILSAFADSAQHAPPQSTARSLQAEAQHALQVQAQYATPGSSSSCSTPRVISRSASSGVSDEGSPSALSLTLSEDQPDPTPLSVGGPTPLPAAVPTDDHTVHPHPPDIHSNDTPHSHSHAFTPELTALDSGMFISQLPVTVPPLGSMAGSPTTSQTHQQLSAESSSAHALPDLHPLDSQGSDSQRGVQLGGGYFLTSVGMEAAPGSNGVLFERVSSSAVSLCESEHLSGAKRLDEHSPRERLSGSASDPPDSERGDLPEQLSVSRGSLSEQPQLLQQPQLEGFPDLDEPCDTVQDEGEVAEQQPGTGQGEAEASYGHPLSEQLQSLQQPQLDAQRAVQGGTVVRLEHSLSEQLQPGMTDELQGGWSIDDQPSPAADSALLSGQCRQPPGSCDGSPPVHGEQHDSSMPTHDGVSDQTVTLNSPAEPSGALQSSVPGHRDGSEASNLLTGLEPDVGLLQGQQFQGSPGPSDSQEGLAKRDYLEGAQGFLTAVPERLSSIPSESASSAPEEGGMPQHPLLEGISGNAGGPEDQPGASVEETQGWDLKGNELQGSEDGNNGDQLLL